MSHRKACTHTCAQLTYRHTIFPFYSSPLSFILYEEKKLQGPGGKCEYLKNLTEQEPEILQK